MSQSTGETSGFYFSLTASQNSVLVESIRWLESKLFSSLWPCSAEKSQGSGNQVHQLVSVCCCFFSLETLQRGVGWLWASFKCTGSHSKNLIYITVSSCVAVKSCYQTSAKYFKKWRLTWVTSPQLKQITHKYAHTCTHRSWLFAYLLCLKQQADSLNSVSKSKINHHNNHLTLFFSPSKFLFPTK